MVTAGWITTYCIVRGCDWRVMLVLAVVIWLLVLLMNRRQR